MGRSSLITTEYTTPPGVDVDFKQWMDSRFPSEDPTSVSIREAFHKILLDAYCSGWMDGTDYVKEHESAD